MSTDKSFQISKALVWEAYQKVAANKGAPGVDEQSIVEFEKDLKNNLYRIWNPRSALASVIVLEQCPSPEVLDHVRSSAAVQARGRVISESRSRAH